MLKIIKASLLIFISLCLAGCTPTSSTAQWAIDNNGKKVNGEVGTAGIDIDFIQTPNSSHKTIVAIIDTGFVNSPQLAENIFFNTKEIALDGIDNDKNGYIDDISGWNFSDNSHDTQTKIISSHGTEVAHIISGNSKEYMGVSSNSLLINIRIDEEYLSPELLTEAILFAENAGAKVVNLSLCLKENNETLYEVMKKSKMLFVCAAGNNHMEECLYPGKYDLSNIISVGGINSKGLVSSFSNFGLDVDIAAPGENILVLDKNLDLKYDSGSSLAAAYVSGISAEMIANAKGSISASKVKEILLATSKKEVTLDGFIKCGGIVSMKNAISYIIDNQT